MKHTNIVPLNHKLKNQQMHCILTSIVKCPYLCFSFTKPSSGWNIHRGIWLYLWKYSAFVGFLIYDLISECTENIMWNIVPLVHLRASSKPQRTNLLFILLTFANIQLQDCSLVGMTEEHCGCTVSRKCCRRKNTRQKYSPWPSWTGRTSQTWTLTATANCASMSMILWWTVWRLVVLGGIW